MTVGAKLVLEVVAGITSLDARERDIWADRTGFDLADYSGVDDDERRVLAPGHVWCMCIEPSVDVRESFLSSIDHLAVYEAVSPTVVAEIQGWLAATGTDPRAEVDYVETFTEIVQRTTAVPEIPLTPQRAAPFVDVLRGITSADENERARAAGIMLELLPDLRPEEQRGFTGVLARAAAVEQDRVTRSEQLRVLVVADEVGAVHAHDRDLLLTSLKDALSLADAERRALMALRHP